MAEETPNKGNQAEAVPMTEAHKEAVEALADSEARNRLNNLIAISVAILSVFMAVTKVKDDNIVQAMLQAKSDAVDTWGQYQAKRIKHHMLELGRDQATTFRAITSELNAKVLDEQINHYNAEIARYTDEEAKLQDQARGFEKQYDDLNFRDDQFDLSDATLSISLGMLAVAALANKKWLLYMAWGFGIFGILIGLSGLFGLGLHPNWLIKPLT